MTMVPIVASADDLDEALRFAQLHPTARWYVAGRAQALGALDRIPEDWGLPASAPLTAGIAGEGEHLAREAKSAFEEAMHPRGKDGRFIEKGGHVVVDGPGGSKFEGIVQDVRRDASGGAVITVKKDVGGETVSARSTQIAQAPTAKAHVEPVTYAHSLHPADQVTHDAANAATRVANEHGTPETHEAAAAHHDFAAQRTAGSLQKEHERAAGEHRVAAQVGRGAPMLPEEKGKAPFAPIRLEGNESIAVTGPRAGQKIESAPDRSAFAQGAEEARRMRGDVPAGHRDQLLREAPSTHPETPTPHPAETHPTQSPAKAAKGQLLVTHGLEYENYDENAHKFYESSVVQHGDGQYSHVTRWGRMGASKPGVKVDTYGSREEAMAAHAKKTGEKESKGYYSTGGLWQGAASEHLAEAEARHTPKTPSPREMQDAEHKLGAERSAEISPGGLSEATPAQARQLVDEAKSASTPGPDDGPTLRVANEAQRVLMEEHIKGQISDGMWENTNHGRSMRTGQSGEGWKDWTDANVVVDPEHTGRNFAVSKDNYQLNSSNLVGIVGDDMLKSVREATGNPDYSEKDLRKDLAGLSKHFKTRRDSINGPKGASDAELAAEDARQQKLEQVNEHLRGQFGVNDDQISDTAHDRAAELVHGDHPGTPQEIASQAETYARDRARTESADAARELSQQITDEHHALTSGDESSATSADLRHLAYMHEEAGILHGQAGSGTEQGHHESEAERLHGLADQQDAEEAKASELEDKVWGKLQEWHPNYGGEGDDGIQETISGIVNDAILNEDPSKLDDPDTVEAIAGRVEDRHYDSLSANDPEGDGEDDDLDAITAREEGLPDDVASMGDRGQALALKEPGAKLQSGEGAQVEGARGVHVERGTKGEYHTVGDDGTFHGSNKSRSGAEDYARQVANATPGEADNASHHGTATDYSHPLHGVAKSIGNKGGDQSAAHGRIEQIMADDNHEQAHRELAKLMGEAKLGGKQRARYRELLNQHHGSGGSGRPAASLFEGNPVAERLAESQSRRMREALAEGHPDTGTHPADTTNPPPLGGHIGTPAEAHRAEALRTGQATPNLDAHEALKERHGDDYLKQTAETKKAMRAQEVLAQPEPFGTDPAQRANMEKLAASYSDRELGAAVNRYKAGTPAGDVARAEKARRDTERARAADQRAQESARRTNPAAVKQDAAPKWKTDTREEEFAGEPSGETLTTHKTDVNGYSVIVDEPHKGYGWRYSVRHGDQQLAHDGRTHYDQNDYSLKQFRNAEEAKAAAVEAANKLPPADTVANWPVGTPVSVGRRASEGQVTEVREHGYVTVEGPNGFRTNTHISDLTRREPEPGPKVAQVQPSASGNDIRTATADALKAELAGNPEGARASSISDELARRRREPASDEAPEAGGRLGEPLVSELGPRERVAMSKELTKAPNKQNTVRSFLDSEAQHEKFLTGQLPEFDDEGYRLKLEQLRKAGFTREQIRGMIRRRLGKA